MYVESTDQDFAVFETLSLKFYSFSPRLQMGVSNRDVLQTAVAAPFFRGLASFPEVTVRSRDGRKAKYPTTEETWELVLRRVKHSEVVAVGLQTPQAEYHVVHDELLLTLVDGEPGEEGVNQLSVVVGDASSGREHFAETVDAFQELVELFEASYAFGNVHIDMTDSTVLDDVYALNISQKPIDTMNVNRFEWDCQRVIKDVCWLNFLSYDHLSSCDGWEVILGELPCFRRTARGAVFAISTDPYEIDSALLYRLRAFFAHLISDSAA